MDTATDTPTPPAKGQPIRYRDRIAWALGILLVLALALALVWSTGAERRALERMDPVERRLVYESAFAELQRLCGAGPRGDALETRCTEQVAYVLLFPECDETCQRIARSHAPRPTK